MLASDVLAKLKRLGKKKVKNMIELSSIVLIKRVKIMIIYSNI